MFVTDVMPTLLGCGNSIYTLEIEVPFSTRFKQRQIMLLTFPEELERYIYIYDGAVMRRWGDGGDQCCIDCVLKTTGKRPTKDFEEP